VLTTRHSSIHKSWHYISSSGGRSDGIVRSRTKGHGVFVCFCLSLACWRSLQWMKLFVVDCNCSLIHANLVWSC
jgi:hypothetical protein